MQNKVKPNGKASVTANGKTVEMPVYSGTVGPDVIDIGKLYAQTGMFTLDPGFTSTASCESQITYIDGDQGILLHRGYPIDQLAEKSNFLEVCYLLLYGAGGLYWPLNLVTRPFAEVLGQAEVDRCIGAAGMAANKRRTILDDLFVPILETYTVARVDQLLGGAGFATWRRWAGGQNDHESDPATLVAELKIREQLWRAGADGAEAGAAEVEVQLATLTAEMVSCFAAGKFEDCLLAAAEIERTFGPTKLTSSYAEEAEARRGKPPDPAFRGQIQLIAK
jgi:hypothetical protein